MFIGLLKVLSREFRARRMIHYVVSASHDPGSQIA